MGAANGPGNPESEFLDNAVWHGPLDRASELLTAHPEIASASIYTAALLGDDAGVRRFLAADPSSATAKGGPRAWDALTYLCFSKYLQHEPAGSEGFVRAAQALLDAGVSPNAGFFEHNHRPNPEYESVLYGAAGVAHHAPLTRLLLERGADPNDGEVAYHAPEGYDNAAMQVLVESGKLTADSLATMLLRKHDWHDYDGIRWLLEHGADANRLTYWKITAFHQAIRRDNALKIVEALLDHGADPKLSAHPPTVMDLAARRGRGDVLDLFEHRGIAIDLTGVEALLADIARHRSRGGGPEAVAQLRAAGGQPLAEFAGNDNAEGVRLLLDLGIAVDAVFADGDIYWDVARNSTALHVAAWRASHQTLKLLISRGAAVNARDGKGRTPLALAVRACVDSYWTRKRSPDSVAALLAAGASAEGIQVPTGYAEIDTLLQTQV
ncbi:MAG TPA: ankyrin repeat domain-containing protein [Bryobacteraceae bacterium]|nr:ankyrin repeat domain-containing protein [Bryobacteraceae bacterium]